MEKLSEFTPCSRVLNGFRICPVEVSSGFVWSIRPNHSDRVFYFSKLSLAEGFAKKYNNCHSDAYWYRLWLKNPLYHFVLVKKMVDSISYML